MFSKEGFVSYVSYRSVDFSAASSRNVSDQYFLTAVLVLSFHCVWHSFVHVVRSED